jgi:hypothetical protein
VDTELGQQPVANEGPYDPDEQVTDESEPGASHDLARQPSGNEPDQQYHKETFARHMHLPNLQFQHAVGRSPLSPCKRKPDDMDLLAGQHRKYGQSAFGADEGECRFPREDIKPVLGSRLINIGQTRLGMGLYIRLNPVRRIPPAPPQTPGRPRSPGTDTHGRLPMRWATITGTSEASVAPGKNRAEQGVMENYEVEYQFPQMGNRTMLLNARKVLYEGNPHATWLTQLGHLEMIAVELFHSLLRQRRAIPTFAGSSAAATRWMSAASSVPCRFRARANAWNRPQSKNAPMPEWLH